MSEGVVIHHITYFSYCSHYKMKHFSYCVSKNKMVFFLRIKCWVPRQDISICHAYLKVLLTSNSLPLVWLSSCFTVRICSICVSKNTRDDRQTANVRFTSDFVYSTPRHNVSTLCNNNCSSYKTDVRQHLYITQCMNRILIWVY